jgi:general secretion pathway protein L
LKTTLRIALPRLDELQPDSRVAFSLSDARGVLRHGELPLRELAAGMPMARVAAVLHPCDATLGTTDIPPLAIHRIAAALPAVVEPLALADPDTLAIAHGRRNGQGRIPVAWTDRTRLQRAWTMLAEAGLPAEALVPAPLALPLMKDGMTLMLRDGTVVARIGRDEGQALALDALATDDHPGEAIVVWISLLLRQMSRAPIAWVSEVPPWWPHVLVHAQGKPGIGLQEEAPTPDVSTPHVPIVIPPAACRTAELPDWSLAVPELRPPGMQRSAWRTPLAWLGGAAAIWLLGLNLYAGQLLAEERRLAQRMSQQVREAFPDIPVVLDPLRQATQQRDMRRGAVTGVDEAGFLPLALDAARLLPDAANNVARLEYAGDALTMEFADNSTAPDGELDPALATRAHELGLQIDRHAGAWAVRRRSAESAPDSPDGFAISPGATAAQRMRRSGEAG